MDDSELIVHLREFLKGELMSESGSENLADEAQALLIGLERREPTEEELDRLRSYGDMQHPYPEDAPVDADEYHSRRGGG